MKKKIVKVKCRNCSGTGRVSTDKNPSVLGGLFRGLIYDEKKRCPQCNGTGLFVKHR